MIDSALSLGGMHLMFTGIRSWLQMERRKLSGLSHRQRWEYIWSYYKWWFLVLVILLSITITWIQYVRSLDRPLILSGMFINTATTEEGYAFVKEDFRKSVSSEEDTRSELIEAQRILYNAEKPTAMEANAVMSVDAMIACGALDYIICDTEAMEFYTSQEYCMDLQIFFPAGLNDLPVVETPSGFPAIDLTESRLNQEFGLSAQPSFLLIPITAVRTENCVSFINYLFN